MMPDFPDSKSNSNDKPSDKDEPSIMPKPVDGHEKGPLRPPNQFNSLLLRVTRNCTWNRCLFCPFYKGEKFEKRPVEEILRDIDRIAEAVQEIYRVKDRLALEKNATANDVCQHEDCDQGKYKRSLVSRRTASFLYRYDPYLASIAYWLYWGGSKVFLQDADALVVPPQELSYILTYLQERLPAIQQITAYTRGKTLHKRNISALHQLRKSGLTTLHLGLETGYDPLLRFMQKGVSKNAQVEGGKKALQAGFTLTMYVLLGLGGQYFSSQHACETADVINQVKPTFTRLRTLSLREGAPLTRKAEQGEFQPLKDDGIIQELRTFIDHINAPTYLLSDHPLNLLESLSGQLPEEKERLLAEIDAYLNMPYEKRLHFQLGKRWGIYKNLKDMETTRWHREIEKRKQALLKNGHALEDEVERLKHESMI